MQSPLNDEYEEIRSGGIREITAALMESERLLTKAQQFDVRQLVQSPVSRPIKVPTETLIESLAVPPLEVADLIEKLLMTTNSPRKPQVSKQDLPPNATKRKPPSHFYRSFRRIAHPVEFDFRHL